MSISIKLHNQKKC